MLFKDSKKREQKSRMAHLVKQYGTSAFMYTHYPHKRFWDKRKNDMGFREALLSLGTNETSSSSMLYIHMPYCQQLCYFCTCHMSITSEYKKVKEYMAVLFQELDKFAEFISNNSVDIDIKEIHLGGGSPTFIDIPEFDILCDKLSNITKLENLREFAIEVDPRRVDSERIVYYHNKGINRISFGIQDFDINVQKAINRIQPVGLVENLLTSEVRGLFINGINFDIICGLPNQTVDTIRMTAEECVRLSPERICLNYLHYSPVFAPQQKFMMDGRQGRPTKLPDFFERKELFDEAKKVLVDGGYIRTGYDHFAKPYDDVAKALNKKNMYWNSMGPTSGEYTNIIGLGISSESTIGKRYFQNYYDMADYTGSVLDDKFPTYREYELSEDDVLRKDIIQQIRNYFEVDLADISMKYGILVEEYFSNEIEKIKALEKDEILSFESGLIRLSEIGKRFTNIVCRVFDKYYSGMLLKEDLGHR